MLVRLERELEVRGAIFIASATIAVFLTGCIIIIHDISPGFKQLLVSLIGHHWTSVSLIIIVLFVLFSGLLSSSESMRNSLRVYNIGLWTTAMLIVTLLMILEILVELTFRFLAD